MNDKIKIFNKMVQGFRASGSHLSLEQFSLMVLLAENPQVTTVELNDLCAIPRVTMRRHASKLEGMGLIAVTPDENTYRYRLTPAGRKLVSSTTE